MTVKRVAPSQSKTVFDHDDYKKFLEERLAARGSRADLCRAIGCQTAFLSQVMAGKLNLSLEQAEAVNTFLRHDEDESDFFLLLVQEGRAGTLELRARLRRQRERILRARANLKNRVRVSEGLLQEQQTIYYSSWIYGAVHALASVPETNTVEMIAKRLGLEIPQVHNVVQFLLKSGLVEQQKNGTLKVVQGAIHLPQESPLIGKHHTNWRHKAIERLDPLRATADDLHYSSIVSLSKADAAMIRERLVKMILDAKSVIRESKEETIRGFCIDFFGL